MSPSDSSSLSRWDSKRSEIPVTMRRISLNRDAPRVQASNTAPVQRRPTMSSMSCMARHPWMPMSSEGACGSVSTYSRLVTYHRFVDCVEAFDTCAMAATMKKLALDLSDKMWPVIARFAAAHTAIYRKTNGRIGHKAPALPTILLLDHVGARSGIARTTPLLYFRNGRAFVVVAAKGGYSRHPAWYHNLLAHPDTTVQVRSQKLTVHARVADAQELDRLWPVALGVYPTYRSYRERTEREIPFVILEPVD